MTDSESETFNPNVFTFQNVNTTVSARGPNTNISNFSFRNQLTSTMYMPRTFERPRYAESVSDQRSIYYRREMSPMSIHSACDIRPRNGQQYYSGMGSSQSVFKGRSGSPMSMRSINSNASVSAADIAFAFKNVKFNKYDLKVIQEAYHKLMRQRNRKRIEKRRNMRLFLKGSRNRSGGDSGEQGSDSSISSDDCRSVKTSYKENISSSRLARIDPVDFRNTFKDSNMVKDCTKSLKQNSFRNMFSIGTSNYNRNQMLNSTLYSNQTQPSLKERFKTGFVLPSQRFNSSVASTVIPENTERQPKNMQNNNKHSGGSMENRNVASESEEDNIFPDVTVLSKTASHTGTLHKRTLESEDDSSLPDRKKAKNSSPNKIPKSKTQQPRAKNISPINNNDKHSNNNFEFTKPTLPIRKSRPMVKEKVIAKSKQPPIETYSPKINDIETTQPIISPEKSDINQTQAEQSELSQNSEVSMRPSFIKRKLFTQKLDVVEKGNISSDASNSPQNVYSALQKEKNRTRKLVTSQSCMNREVKDDNNLLELIHKIVPPDCINKTNQTSINVTKMDVNHSNKKDDDDDAWDVTSVISICNDHNVSDTFTDEEIFESDDKKGDKAKKGNNVNHSPKTRINTKPKAMKTVAENNPGAKDCRIVIDKIPKNVVSLKTATQNGSGESMVKSSAKTFWDTDFESDAECHITAQNRHLKESLTTVNTVTEISKPEFKQPLAVSRSPTSRNEKRIPETSKWLNSTKNTTDLNNTIDNTRRFNISSLSVRTHRASKKKKCCNETGYQEMFFKSASKALNEAKNATEPPISNGKNNNEPVTNCKITSNPAESKCKTKSNQESKCKSKPSESKLTNSDKHNKISSKPEPNASNPKLSNQNVSNKKNPSFIEPLTSSSVNTEITKNKKDNKPMSNSRNSNKSTSTSRTRKSPRDAKSPTRTRKSPRETKSKADQENNRKMNVLNQSISDRPIRSCRSRTPSLNRLRENSRSSQQFNISPLTTILHRTPKKKNVTSFQAITPLSENIIKPKLKANKKSITNGKTKTDVEKIPKSNIQNVNISISSAPTRKSPRIKKSKEIKVIPSYQTPKLDRPIRLCRTPNQNRSMENYKRR